MAGKSLFNRAILVAVLALGLGADTAPSRAASLDGAGRIVILPYAVSGRDRESMIYLTNPSSRYLRIGGLYVGADGTPLAASKVGIVYCAQVGVGPGETYRAAVSAICPLGTPDVENLGYVEFITYGGNDAAPFFVTSVVNTLGGSQFGVDGVPAGAFDSGVNSLFRTQTLRVIGLAGEVVGSSPVDQIANCYLATLGEDKEVTVQLMEYGGGAAKPLGSPNTYKLPAWTMQRLGNVLAQAGLAAGTYANVTAEFYAAPSGPFGIGSDGASLIAACGVETLATRTEDFRLARTPAPRDDSRSRAVVHGDSRFEVGPFLIGYGMPQGTKARMALYLRHEDRVRCWLTPSVVRPLEDPVPYQELQVLDPDQNIVAGGSDISDTGEFFTGVKNAVHGGVNGRWTIEVSWRETSPGVYPQVPVTPNAFGVSCQSTSGASHMMPLDSPVDDF
jgi:hypothetical protein